jgi:ADP-ribose pyrophosphatase
MDLPSRAFHTSCRRIGLFAVYRSPVCSLARRSAALRVVPAEIMPKWKILESQIVIDTPHLRMRRDRIQTTRGDIVDGYHVRETRGFVVIFALTPNDEVVLVRQYKHGIAEDVLELPAGAIDPGETPAAAATRELEEETGYVVGGELELIRTFITDPTNSNGRFTLFFGRNATLRRAQNLDLTEEISVVLVPIGKVLGLVRDGSINVAPQVGSIYTVLDRLDMLGR